MQMSGSYKRISGVYSSQQSTRKEFSIKSDCDIKLSELEQQLNVAEAKCGSLKSQMDYMKILYQGVQPERGEVEKIADIDQGLRDCPSVQIPPMNVSKISEENFRENVTDSEDMLYSKFLQQIKKIQEIAIKESETEKSGSYVSPSLTVRLPEITSECMTENVDSGTKEENDEDDHLSEFVTERKTFPAMDSFRLVTQTSSPVKQKVHGKIYVDDTTNHHPYQKYLAEYSAGLQDDIISLKTSIERLVSADNVNLQEKRSPQVEDDTKEIILNDSQIANTTREVKRRKTVKVDKKQKVPCSSVMSKKLSGSKLSESMGLKIKKRKGKLRSSTSKSTVMTKETNSIVKREIKKRKHKNASFVSHLSKKPSIPRIQQNRSEVVEIFHNAGLKSGSVSVVSSRHAVLYPCLKNANKKFHHPQNVQEKRHFPQKHVFQHTELLPQKISQQERKLTTPQQNKPESLKTTVVRRVVEMENRSVDDQIDQVPQKCSTIMNKNHNLYENPRMDAVHYDRMVVRNYELPTLASELKRSNCSYFHRFNFKNIPFVVGTSVTPSHNLGLNIQQVLSIMKSRQPTIGGMTPLLIRKVSRGMKPVSVLMELNNQNFKLDQDAGNDDRAADMCGRNDIINETASLRFMKQTPIAQSLRSVPNAQNYFPQSTRGSKIIQEDVRGKGEGNIGDFQNAKSVNSPNNSKGIQGVLIKLHDQLEEMNIKYEKLQEKAEKSNDKALTKEISALEKELDAKEEEINAVIGLHKEVMALKQQMRMLQEKNSFICFSTELPSLPKTNPSFRAGINFTSFTPRRGNAFIREPSTSIKLAGLLRQIQMFQKQLTLAP